MATNIFDTIGAGITSAFNQTIAKATDSFTSSIGNLAGTAVGNLANQLPNWLMPTNLAPAQTNTGVNISVPPAANTQPNLSSTGNQTVDNLLKGLLGGFLSTPIGTSITNQAQTSVINTKIADAVKSPITWILIAGGIILLFLVVKK